MAGLWPGNRTSSNKGSEQTPRSLPTRGSRARGLCRPLAPAPRGSRMGRPLTSATSAGSPLPPDLAVKGLTHGVKARSAASRAQGRSLTRAHRNRTDVAACRSPTARMAEWCCRDHKANMEKQCQPHLSLRCVFLNVGAHGRKEESQRKENGCRSGGKGNQFPLS